MLHMTGRVMKKESVSGLQPLVGKTLNKREIFAAMAMQALIATPPKLTLGEGAELLGLGHHDGLRNVKDSHIKIISIMALKHADALIKALDENK
jgi:hypothetical protein